MSDPVDSRPSSGQPADDAGTRAGTAQFGLTSATALIIGSIVGVGIFNLPTSLATFGPISLVSMALTTVGAVALAILFAALSRRLPADGGPYAYARAGFGNALGFTNAWSYWITAWAGNAAIAVGWVLYVEHFVNTGHDPLFSVLLVLIGLWIPAATFRRSAEAVASQPEVSMRIVLALGGNALLRRSDPMTTAVQRRNIRTAAQAIAPLAAEHDLIVVHGNGPQVGLLSLQSEYYRGAEPYPLDVLDAGTQGMIGYLIQQELRRVLPPGRAVATVLTMITVDPDDPAFANPTKFVGPGYPHKETTALARHKGWEFRPDGEAWRRVVPSPEPQQILEIEPISWLLERGSVVVCAGGGGIPTLRSPQTGGLAGVEAVIDKDLAGELLSTDISADLFVMATDVDGVYLDWGTPAQRRLGEVTPEDLLELPFAAGSMGPKVEAAVRFVGKTGRRAAIGSLADIPGIVAGTAGTNVVPSARADGGKGGST